MSTFHADFYDFYRPLYPAATYAGLPSTATALDLGCGTGQSAESLARMVSGVLHVLDPDDRMLARARTRLPGATFHLSSAESVPLPDASMDLITIASAFHWMDRARVRDECKRLLRPGGHLLIYEYQFPKCAALPDLNEWIRRQFNQLWKAPGQVPRGSFRGEVLAPLRGDPALRLISEGPVPMRLTLTPEQLHGLILSQSRYLHYERTLVSDRPRVDSHGVGCRGVGAVSQERARIFAEISARFAAAPLGAIPGGGHAGSGNAGGDSAAEFDFALARAFFTRS